MKTVKYILFAAVTIAMTACSKTKEPEATDLGLSVKTKEPEATDLGLSVKWASFNLGATAPEEKGDLFAWGEVSSKESYTPGNSDTYQVSMPANLTDETDAATKNLGNGWRMPTENEFQELISKCKWEWTRVNKVPGYTVTGPNGNSIFLPITDSENAYNPYGWYWTSSNDTKDNDKNEYARGLDFNDEYKKTSYGDRCSGRAIRAVK